MYLITDIFDLKSKINAVKQRCEKCFTNYYVNDDKIVNWIGKKEIYILTSDSAIIIQRKRHDMSQIYFIANSIESMTCLMKCGLKKMSKGLAIALLGDVEQYISPLKTIGFNYHVGINRVVKFVKNNDKEPVLKKGVELAKFEDAQEIHDVMCEYFDIYADQILDVDEIEDVIKKNGVLVIRNDKEIQAFYLFECKGITSQALYIAVRTQYRDKPLGLLLLNSYFHFTPYIKRHIGWIKENNIQSIAIHDRLGFSNDGFKQVVMTY